MKKCNFCHRTVHPTSHTRDQYQVDFYEAMTGTLERVLQNTEEGEVIFYRLAQPQTLIICVDCFQNPNLRQQYLS